MKTQVLKHVLKEGLSFAERAAAKSPTLPILQNVSLTADGNVLEIAATDLEMGIRYRALAKTKQNGQAVVPPRVLSQLLSLTQDSAVELQTTNNHLVVASKEHITSIKTLNPEDFPLIPSLGNEEEQTELDAASFIEGLSQVAPIAGQSQTRPEITGVLFLFQKDQLVLAATDSFRLAEKTIPLRRGAKGEKRFIVPTRTAKELVGMLGDKEGKITAALSATQAVFEYEEPAQAKLQVVSRLLEGDYPQYQDVIPKETKIAVRADRAELLNRVKAASIFSGRGSEVRLFADAEQKSLEVSSQSGEVGETSSSLDAEIMGKGQLAVAFNWRFLAEGMGFMKSQQVELRFTSEDGAALVLPSKQEERYRYVVMPVKA